MDTDEIDDADDMGIVGVRVTLTYSEDETSSGLDILPLVHLIKTLIRLPER